MIVNNLYKAVATHNLFMGDIGVIENGNFIPLKFVDLMTTKVEDAYQVVENCNAGDIVLLAGHDTVFHCENFLNEKILRIGKIDHNESPKDICKIKVSIRE